jgi:thiamine-phosphate pyrophosphorylase
MRLVLPRLYVILDAALLTLPETQLAASLAEAGVRLLQYRNKQASARELLEKSRALAGALVPRKVTFIVNDRPDVAALAGASGVHLGQDDLGVEAARTLMEPNGVVGVSTHNEAQFRAAVSSSADYIAIGPIFATSSKRNPDPVVGLETIRQVRRLTDKPIVAIGGITLERAPEVIAAGANTVAVISDILRAADPAERARQYIDSLERTNHAAAV